MEGRGNPPLLLSQENLPMNANSNGLSLLDYPANARRHSVSGPSGGKYVTDAPNEVSCQAPLGSSVTDDTNTTGKNRFSIHHQHRIGTWNVNGLLQTGKLSIVEREMSEHRISVLGICETHLRGQGHFKTAAGSTLYFSGQTDSSRNGVGVLRPADLNRYVLGYNPVSDRIISLKLNTTPCIMNIIVIYAPTAQASDEIIQNFYGILQRLLEELPRREITMIIGDWNAKVGNTANDDHIRLTLGRFGLGTRNERGQKLIEFCVDHKLTITNTCFKHHPRRLYTWRSPGDRYRNQIDYVLVSNRWKSSVKNVKAFPGADCGSDHVLLVATFMLRLKSMRSQPKMRPKTLNPQEAERFRANMDDQLKCNPPPQDANAETLWEYLKCRMFTSLDGVEANKKVERRRSIWMSDETWEIIERRKTIKARGLNNPSMKKEYSILCKVIQKRCRHDKNLFIEGICREVESHSLKSQTSDLFKKVRLLTKQFKPKTWIIEDADGKQLNELDKVANRWRIYCQQLYSDQHTSTYPPTVIDWDGMELEPDILRSEICSAISALKNNKAPGPDLITAEVIKSLDKSGTEILFNICNHVWRHGDWPKDWVKSTIIPLHKKGSTKKCENYRTLSLIAHASKILLHIINNRIRYYLD